MIKLALDIALFKSEFVSLKLILKVPGERLTRYVCTLNLTYESYESVKKPKFNIDLCPEKDVSALL